MKIIRFVLPFLFVRNWYNGSWEFSRARCLLFAAAVLLVVLGAAIAYALNAPVLYSASYLL